MAAPSGDAGTAAAYSTSTGEQEKEGEIISIRHMAHAEPCDRPQKVQGPDQQYWIYIWQRLYVPPIGPQMRGLCRDAV